MGGNHEDHYWKTVTQPEQQLKRHKEQGTDAAIVLHMQSFHVQRKEDPGQSYEQVKARLSELLSYLQSCNSLMHCLTALVLLTLSSVFVTPVRHLLRQIKMKVKTAFLLCFSEQPSHTASLQSVSGIWTQSLSSGVFLLFNRPGRESPTPSRKRHSGRSGSATCVNRILTTWAPSAEVRELLACWKAVDYQEIQFAQKMHKTYQKLQTFDERGYMFK